MLTRAELERLDAQDPLARWREAFALPDGVIYLDGNSLGALPKATVEVMAEAVQAEWGEGLITSWNRHGWIDLPRRIGGKIAGLIGAMPHEVIVCDSISVNLFKLLAAALRLRPGRTVVLSERTTFPTDLYVVQGLERMLESRVRQRLVEPDEIEAALGEDVAVLMLTHVDYRSGRLRDMAGLTRAAHDAGALALWDLAHSAGALPVDLNAAAADLAVGCGYKFLNGGPGAPAFVFVAERWQEAAEQPLAGWFGHRAPFAFAPQYRPAEGIDRFLAGTPPILSLKALEAGVDLLCQVDGMALRTKSQQLTQAFIELVEERCAGLGVSVASPRDAHQRGSQVALRHPDGYAIVQALIARGVIGDFRAPDLLRFGFAALYVRYVDVLDAADALRDILVTRAWDRAEFKERGAVT